MKLSGFDYIDAAGLLSKYNNEDKIKLYSCIGGTPYYLSRIDNQLSFEKNLEEEPLLLLKQELREGAMYNSIISAIALGAAKLNDIAVKTGEERSKIIKYLDTLIGLNILFKEFPFGENPEKSRKGIYRIKDNCYRFWYRYVFMNKAIIEQGAGAALLNSFLPEINSFIGGPFEEICMQYMIRLNNLSKLPFIFTQFGRWWEKDAEIDIVFSDNSKKKFIFAECKWRNNIKDTAALKSLIEKSNSLISSIGAKNNINTYFYLFSKAPFSKSCESLANQMGNVSLIGMNDLFKIVK
jgi:hypothetical protein